MIQSHAAVALLALVLGGGTAWQVQAWRYDAREAERLEAERELRVQQARRADSAAASHEVRREQIAAEVRTIIREVEHVVERPLYRDRCLDDDGLHLLRRAVGDPTAAGEPAPAVPDADGPGRRHGRDDAALVAGRRDGSPGVRRPAPGAA